MPRPSRGRRPILERCTLPSVSPTANRKRMNGQASIRLGLEHAHGATAARVRLCKVKVKHRQLRKP
ncbi:hypothetical protein CCMA1212_001433 [Trichoderma ghanense]|uniref:Uncharacterized protein n=1 Tax=Trichoderma ghanense TaxID=65468 RepID=A0ABY2HBH4_9HYPO